MLEDWELHLPLFVKVMPRDYKRALAELESENGNVSAGDDHPISSGGEGFLTTESESARAAV